MWEGFVEGSEIMKYHTENMKIQICDIKAFEKV